MQTDIEDMLWHMKAEKPFNEIQMKVYSSLFLDFCLLGGMPEEAQEDLRANKNLGVYKGALYESIVGEALTKCGYGLYYLKKEDSTLGGGL